MVVLWRPKREDIAAVAMMERRKRRRERKRVEVEKGKISIGDCRTMKGMGQLPFVIKFSEAPGVKPNLS
jgi:hypothetical protein